MDGKVALVTGASSGIGAGIAERFAKLGCNLAITGRDGDKLKTVGKSCCDRGLTEKQVLLISADLTIDEDIDRVLNETIARFGRLDILINNVGRPAMGTYNDSGIDIFDDVMRINLRSVVYLSKIAIQYLKESKGCVVNMSSVASKTIIDDNPIYQLSKAAMDNFTQSFAVEMGVFGVRVNSLNPGIIMTPLYGRLGLSDETVIEISKTAHPLGRYGTVEEVAKATEYLVSDAARCVTGALIFIDGARRVM